jgi:hypothetical protein
MNGISALIKTVPENSAVLLPCEDTAKKTNIYEPGSRTSPDTDSASTLILDFPVPRIVKNKFPLSIVTPSIVFYYRNWNELRQHLWRALFSLPHPIFIISIKRSRGLRTGIE